MAGQGSAGVAGDLETDGFFWEILETVGNFWKPLEIPGVWEILGTTGFLGEIFGSFWRFLEISGSFGFAELPREEFRKAQISGTIRLPGERILYGTDGSGIRSRFRSP